MQIALAQMTTTRNLNANLDYTEKLCTLAKKEGASWILFPENAPFMGRDSEKLEYAEPIDGPIIRTYCGLAKVNELWITVGSFPERSDDENKTYNTLVMISPEGKVVQSYRKIHRFDAVTPSGTYEESKYVLAGNEVKTCTLTFKERSFTVGLSICYDLRFPELYRELRAMGAEIILVPAAFTLETGRDHWHPLLQARAIENQVYILAPNQFGHHFDNRWSYGHSVAYDPWGRQIACASDRVGLTMCRLDLDYLDEVRKRMPCQQHRVLE